MSVLFSFHPRQFIKQRPAGNRSYDSGFTLRGDNGATVILIHGLTGTPSEMKSLAGHLHMKGYSVVCPRLANHGEPIRVLKDTKWQDLYESVRQILTTGKLADEKGPVFTGGISMGALLALLLAYEFPDRIRGVTCLAPTIFYDGWNMPLSKYLLPLGYLTPLKYFSYFKEEPPYGIKNEAIRQRVHKYYSNAKLDDMGRVAQHGYPYFPVTLLYQLHLLVKHLGPKLKDMRVPVQLIQAKDDDVASISNSKYIYDRIGSRMKELILLYDSYHVITADQERDIVAEKVGNFFDRILADAKAEGDLSPAKKIT